MKRIFNIFMAFTLIICLAGCGSSSNGKNTVENDEEYAAEIINSDFETKDFTGWNVEDDNGILLVRNDDWAAVNTSYFVKVQAEKDGSFMVSQKIKAAETDSYIGAVNYEGSDSFVGKITFSVLVNDNESAAVDITPSKGWDIWNVAVTDEIAIKEGDIVTLQITGNCVSGDWADFGDIIFVKASEAQETVGSKKEVNSVITAEGAVGSGSIDWKGITYNGVNVNGGNFIKGVDISSLISLEKSGVVYHNADGEEQDLISLFQDAGINYVRLRVWNDPYAEGAEKTPENSYGGRCVRFGLRLSDCKTVR